MSLVGGLSAASALFGSLASATEDLTDLEEAAEQSEDEDLYAGLECDDERADEGGTIVVRQQRQHIQELEAALAQRDEHITSLQAELASKGDEVQQLAAQRIVLLTNISSLFKTAQAEIKRHTSQLQSTRLELVQLKAQLARTQRQPAAQVKPPKQQQQLPLPPRQQQQQQQQQQLPPPPKKPQQQQVGQALHDITGSCVNQKLHATQQAQQQQRSTHIQTPPQQQWHGRSNDQVQRPVQQQQQQASRADANAAVSCKRCRSSSPHRSNSGRPAEAPAAANSPASDRYKQQKQHAGADAGAGKPGIRSTLPSSNNGSSRPASNYNNGRQEGCSRPGATRSSAGRAADGSRVGGASGSSNAYNNGHGSGHGSGSSNAYNNGHGSGVSSGRSRSPGRRRVTSRGGHGSGGSAAGSCRDVHRAGSPVRRQDRRRN